MESPENYLGKEKREYEKLLDDLKSKLDGLNKGLGVDPAVVQDNTLYIITASGTLRILRQLPIENKGYISMRKGKIAGIRYCLEHFKPQDDLGDQLKEEALTLVDLLDIRE